jgi:hypothetical protein
MFLGDNAGPFQSEQDWVVCPYHLGVLAVCHGLNKDGVAINFIHNHDVLVAMKRLGGELAGLVGGHGFAYHVRWVYKLCTFLPWRWEMLHVSNGSTFAFALVDHTFFLVWFRCPFAVSMVSG